MHLFRKKKLADILVAGEEGSHGSLSRHLGVRDLTAFGIAAIIGAGIFSTIGKASFDGGPGVIFLFIFVALACSCAAFAYAEFASMIPVSGSAYTYSYVAFGEFFAWIIGWALIMEYAIGNVTVAISWSDYFTSLLDGVFHVRMPEWLTTDYFTARRDFHATYQEWRTGVPMSKVLADHPSWREAALAYIHAPRIGNFSIVFDLPAQIINFLVTLVVYRGIRESRNASNIMVGLKIFVVILVIVAGVSYVNASNFHPFLPNGISGLLKGISAVFFAYIGFDAISTTAEECRNPQKDLPRGILSAIIICTVLYVLVALVLTGMVNYKELNVGDPLAYVFSKVKGISWLSGVIAVSAVVAMASVMLVFQLGQPRIWMSMSRDGLLPPAFSRIHGKFRTPTFSTIVTGFLVGIPLFFIDAATVTDICSAGTLFAFCLVCGGVLRLQRTMREHRGFRSPYVNSKYVLPFLFVATIATLICQNELREKFFHPENQWMLLDNIPVYLFIIGFAVFTVMAWKGNYSLIPSLGLLSCFYMLSQLGYKNWLYFLGWLVAGLVVYFAYGHKHSKLAV